MRLPFLFVVCTALAGAESKTIITFGDSLTAPRNGVFIYSDVLAAKLGSAVVNKGIRGNTSEQARARFAADVLALHPHLVIVQLGTNDAAVDVWKSPPARGPRVALERFRENLHYFIRELRARNCRLILMPPNRMQWTAKLRELYGRDPYDPASADGLNLILDLYA